MDLYRIHGDNIVECERIAQIIINETNPTAINVFTMSPSTIVIEIDFEYENINCSWRLELLPGFNKANRHRWKDDIFKALRSNGSFLDETPDAIITSVKNDVEQILFAVEFCSALQAGNQAWQRSGRAFSTGRAGCPYLYVVEFVKYELKPKSRERKALRYPNPTVPFSYINFSHEINNFVAQVYVRSEEFNKLKDVSLSKFDETNFAEKEFATYMIKKMLNLNTKKEEQEILRKNLNVMLFLTKEKENAKYFSRKDWKEFLASEQNLLDYSIEKNKFKFKKTIATKSQHGKSSRFLKIVDKYSIGIAKQDLPFGIIPANFRRQFANDLKKLYSKCDDKIIEKISNENSHLVLCIIKGFKPGGDDNRPDRGILPLVSMLLPPNTETMAFIYGPIIEHNYLRLLKEPNILCRFNGFWKSIIGLSDYILLDSKIIAKPPYDINELLDTSEFKQEYSKSPNCKTLQNSVFSSVPQEYHEDDVDTGLHFLFTHLFNGFCFEGMCNPPGGDWSGFSVLSPDNKEKRWLSLPRESKVISGKRPDHIFQLSKILPRPILLIVESKEHSRDLEENVGINLINYVKKLMSFVPNVERDISTKKSTWNRATEKVNLKEYEMISCAAYLKSTAQSNSVVFNNSKCDMLFIMDPKENGWEIEIIPSTPRTKMIKQTFIEEMSHIPHSNIVIK